MAHPIISVRAQLDHFAAAEAKGGVEEGPSSYSGDEFDEIEQQFQEDLSNLRSVFPADVAAGVAAALNGRGPLSGAQSAPPSLEDVLAEVRRLSEKLDARLPPARPTAASGPPPEPEPEPEPEPARYYDKLCEDNPRRKGEKKARYFRRLMPIWQKAHEDDLAPKPWALATMVRETNRR
jgi:hypothetical protein